MCAGLCLCPGSPGLGFAGRPLRRRQPLPVEKGPGVQRAQEDGEDGAAQRVIPGRGGTIGKGFVGSWLQPCAPVCGYAEHGLLVCPSQGSHTCRSSVAWWLFLP